MRKPFAVRRNTKISLIFGALLAGVMLGRFGFTFGVSLLPVVVAACAALLLGRTRLALGGLLALALVLGLWRTGAWTADRAQLTSLIGQNVTVTGTIIDDPSLSDKGLLTFKLGYLKLGGRDLPG
ncbi:MAG: hypothetical protein JWN01_205, partial [Patescibacteria group bacterium]|nr:hypothetical protein [Patescibacteria group bacterium]